MLKTSNHTTAKLVSDEQNKMCSPPCKIMFIHWDLLIWTSVCLTSSGHCCYMRLTYSPSTQFVHLPSQLLSCFHQIYTTIL